jgi:hypothetical protein
MSFDILLRDLPDGATAQAAGLTVGYGGRPPRETAARFGSLRLRCASLLKPLYGWAARSHAPYSTDSDLWRRDTEPAVRRSDNPATLRLWWSAGPRPILDTLRGRTGVAWSPSCVDPPWFGGVEVTAQEVVTAYAELALAAAGGEPAAASILAWMRLAEDTFDVPGTAAAGFCCRRVDVGVKCGWHSRPEDGVMRTHAVAIAPVGDRIAVVAALTAIPYPDRRQRDAYRAQVAGGEAVTAEHERVAGPLLRRLISTAVAELGGSSQ